MKSDQKQWKSEFHKSWENYTGELSWAQRSRIRVLGEVLKKKVSEPATVAEAVKLIVELQQQTIQKLRRTNTIREAKGLKPLSYNSFIASCRKPNGQGISMNVFK